MTNATFITGMSEADLKEGRELHRTAANAVKDNFDEPGIMSVETLLHLILMNMYDQEIRYRKEDEAIARLVSDVGPKH